ncbi:MAG: FHIPEP family type III secretion protein [Bdellovibrionales bacterium]|nr:FHIPEP family type III secretion protein [Bdellovibrionales bacterium]
MTKVRYFVSRIRSTLGELAPRSPQSGGTLIACFLLLIVALFLVQLPTWLLDILLVTNIIVALTLMLRGLFAHEAQRLYAFPTILVLTTLFRLALNVSSTKLILLNGDQGLDAAGEVIRGFGMFVVRGDFVVGAIVFAIVAIVNFVVIAKGSARVAEVSARFHLDALPGRQLSIDSELRSGTIGAGEARRRRSQLNQESQFFGSMDGAMKWVQGDAIAGLVITFINAAGGIALGVGRGMSFGDAVSTFGVLTIGDGLVSILPSLLISVAAAIVVTHAVSGDEKTSGDEMVSQMLADPRAPLIAAVALFFVGLAGLLGVFEFPFLPFFVVSALTVCLVALREMFTEGAAIETLDAVPDVDPGYPGDATGLLRVFDRDSDEEDVLDELRLEVDGRVLGPHLGIGGTESTTVPALRGASTATAPAVRRSRQEFEKLAQAARERIFREKGVVLPRIQLSVGRDLAPGAYRVLVREQQLRSGQLRAGQVFAAAGPSTLAVFGVRGAVATRHPVDRRAAAWIDARQPAADSLRLLGVELHSGASFLVLESIGAALEVIDELFGLDEARSLLKTIERRHQQLVQAVFEGELLTYPEFAEVLRRLVRERVSIRDLKLILEGIAEFAALHREIEDRHEWLSELHAFLRIVLARGIINDSLGPGDKLRTFMLAPEIEEEFRSAVSMWDNSRAKPPLDPAFEAELKHSATRMFYPVLERGAVPIVVLCEGAIRAAVQDFFGRQMASSDWIRTLAFEELAGQSHPEAIGILHVGR